MRARIIRVGAPLLIALATAGCPGDGGSETAPPIVAPSERADAAGADAMDAATPVEDIATADVGPPADATRVEDTRVEPPEQTRCPIEDQAVVCAHQTRTLLSGLAGLEPREVHWQVPLGTPPEGGWPPVLLFQGSLFTSEINWFAFEGGPLGMWYQGMTTKALLDAGFAVVAPEAHLQGASFWDTNIPPWSLAWETSPDHQLMVDLLALVASGELGDLNGERLYAAGISSGGYMASRVALTYPNVRAIAVHSASYATCGGAVCLVGPLPEDHPPTVFLHGALDPVVPMWTMDLYRNALEEQGTPTHAVVDPGALHEWIPAAPEAIVEWFLQYP